MTYIVLHGNLRTNEEWWDLVTNNWRMAQKIYKKTRLANNDKNDYVCLRKVEKEDEDGGPIDWYNIYSTDR